MYFLTDQLLTFATSFVTYFGKKCFKCKTKLFNVQELVFNIRSYPTQHHLNALAYGANTCIYFPILDPKIIILVPTQAQSFSFNWIWTYNEGGRGSIFLLSKTFARRGKASRLQYYNICQARTVELSNGLGFGVFLSLLGFVVFQGFFVVFTVFFWALGVTWWQLLGKWLIHMAMFSWSLLSREKLQELL